MEFKVPRIQPIFLLFEILIELFTLGIFSVQGGVKAWFELILVIAALCSCGYLIWWQIPLLMIVIILTPILAGIFCFLPREYIFRNNLTANDQVTFALKTISAYNFNQISTLSGSRLGERLHQFANAQQIFEDNPNLIEQIYELQSVLDHITRSYDVASKVKETDDQNRREEAERLRKEREAYHEKMRIDEAIKVRQAENRQKAKDKEKQEAIANQQRREAWLNEERRKSMYTGGCPPDRSSGVARCPPSYPIKVTLNLNRKEDSYDGIIWHPKDGKRYENSSPVWCYRSIQEAEAERGKYRFRRPKK